MEAVVASSPVPPTIVSLLLIGVAMLYDWRTQRTVHKVYLYCGLAIFLTTGLSIGVSGTDTWLGIARFMESLGG